ncbi:DUF4301 family protein [Marinilabilia rubra]|uniref:DUF4301 domain-containing protein n=1 Tax=Marinilabilia rubra TaxID=2162893 RepID=A0A2U2BC73_9BACT|nr:DUF4301 family protein [Marinilabilia rubra]PWE00660.1 DUF4301 domain-containing protein [Marinilabilia rubra]
MIQKTDFKQLEDKGISQATVEEQIERFREGFPALKIERAATLTDGIIPVSPELLEKYQNIYKQELENGLKPLKFIPASGAATRMFKALYQYLESPEDPDKLPEDDLAKQFITHLPKFAFFNHLKGLLKGIDLNDQATRKAKAKEIIARVLNTDGLNYGFLPKGLIHFHQYPDTSRTPMLEHLIEASCYARDKKGNAKVHFTVSPEHLDLFKKELNENIARIKEQTGTDFDVSFSFQKPHTDTIAVLPDNEPFRGEEGKLLFRPGGHGALIENLNDCVADIIFIKNIDNVVPENQLPLITNYKKALGGLALEIRNKVFSFIDKLNGQLSTELINEIRAFLKETLHTDIPGHLADASIEEQKAYLIKYLDRPVRVCGMVKNEGEPGGGPFRVRNSDGQDTLQIVESSQVNMDNPEQKKIFDASTHFNPVDLVCITKNHQGQKFNLLNYIDHETGFISKKSVSGKTIKALERPGLWNGAMANWLTIFVEVPIETFNPVKTVNDLLRPAHQG